MVWVLVQSGMLSCDSTVNTHWHMLLQEISWKIIYN
jgi:hypothetical protein